MTTLEKLDMNVKQANSDFQAIKDKIEEKGVAIADGTRTADYASKVDEVYKAGRKSQYDESWDASSNVIDWTYRFAGAWWNNTTFVPNYDLILSGNSYCCFNGNRYYGDLVELLKNRGITLTTTKVTNCSMLFAYSHFTRIGEIDLTNAVNLSNTFNSMIYLHTIEKLKVTADNKFDGAFNSVSALENIIIEGTIGQNGFNVQWSTKLSKASITSIINALSATTSGLTVTFSKTAVNNAFSGGSTGEEWINLIATKSNWNISLV